MSLESIPARSPLNAWQAETLRLTAFPSSSAQVPDPTWWHDVVGEDPETRTSQPRQGKLREEGPLKDGKLILAVEPIRIDWLFGPSEKQQASLEHFSTIGSFPEVLDIFIELMRHWFDLDTSPAVQRLAFGATLLQPVENQESGYQQLSIYLRSVHLDPRNSSDFLYQINRRRDSQSKIPGLKINRLSKWSVMQLLQGQFSLPISAELGHSQISTRLVNVACRLELDINTIAEFQGELYREQLSEIFQELVKFGKEIASEGDIP